MSGHVGDWRSAPVNTAEGPKPQSCRPTASSRRARRRSPFKPCGKSSSRQPEALATAVPLFAWPPRACAGFWADLGAEGEDAGCTPCCGPWPAAGPRATSSAASSFPGWRFCRKPCPPHAACSSRTRCRTASAVPGLNAPARTGRRRRDWRRRLPPRASRGSRRRQPLRVAGQVGGDQHGLKILNGRSEFTILPGAALPLGELWPLGLNARQFDRWAFLLRRCCDRIRTPETCGTRQTLRQRPDDRATRRCGCPREKQPPTANAVAASCGVRPAAVPFFASARQRLSRLGRGLEQRQRTPATVPERNRCESGRPV